MAPPTQNKVKLDKNPTGYGVELQCVFIFEESYLLPCVDTLNKVVKDISHTVRASESLNTSKIDGTIYNSWGIRGFLGKSPQPYKDEPLKTVKQFLQDVVEPIDIKMWHKSSKEVHAGRCETWHITNERNLPGVGPAFLKSYVQSRGKPWAENWDSWGIGVVTPLLSIDRNSHLDQIMRVIDVLSKPDTNKFDVLVGNNTGLHVHVAVPKDLAVLKELAFITIIYEEELSRLHPPCRRPGHALANGLLETNRGVFLLKTLEDSPRDEEAKGEPRALEVSLQERVAWRSGAELPRLVPVSTIREKIEACKNEADLAHLMGCPSHPAGGAPLHLVNWSFLTHIPEYQSTVKFRQHRGTFDKGDIRWWIQFVTGLVKVADLYSRQGGCPVTSWADRISVFDLMDSMELSQEGIDFYYMKIASYMNYPKGGPLDRTDWDPTLVGTYKYQEEVEKGVATDHPQSGKKRSGDGIPSTPPLEKQLQGKDDKEKLTAENPQTGKTGRKRSADNIPSTFSPKRAKSGEITEVPSLLGPEQSSVLNKTFDAAAIVETVDTTGPSELVEGLARDVNGRRRDTRPTLMETMYRGLGFVTNTTAAFGEEMLVLDDFGRQVVVTGFHKEDWEVLATKTQAPAGAGLDFQGSMCGIWAILGSLHNQASTLYGLADDHPLKDKMMGMKWHDVYQAVHNQRDKVRPGEGSDKYFSAEQLAMGLQELDERLKLVVVGKNAVTGHEEMATRATGEPDWNQDQLLNTGYNLYIHHSGKPPEEHWQAMKRRDEPA